MAESKFKIRFNPRAFSPKILIVISVFLLSFIFFWSIYMPLYSPDCYFHLSIGRWVFRNHAIPTTNTFTFISPGKEWISNEWLSGLIFYLVYSHWQETGILFLRGMVGILTIFFIYRSLSIQKVNFHLKILATLATSVVIAERLFDRPEIFSFLLFAFLIYLLTSYTKKQKFWFLLPLPLMFLAWPNVQGYAPIGLVVFAYFIGRKILEDVDLKNLKKMPAIFFKQKFFISAFLLSSLAATFTPGQFHRFFYAFFLNKELFGVVAEVQSLFQILSGIKYDFWLYVSLETLFFLFVILLGLIVLGFKFSQKTILVNIVDLCYFVFLIGLAFKYVRMIPLSCLLSIPLIIQNIDTFIPKGSEKQKTTSSRESIPSESEEQRSTSSFPKDKKNNFLLYLFGAPSVFLALIMIVSIFQKSLFAQKSNTLLVSSGPGDSLVSANTTWKKDKPFEAIDFIKKHFAPKKVLTSINWSNIVYWEMDEKTKTYADIIYEKQTKESLSDYLKMAAGYKDWQQILKKYNPDMMLVTQPLNLVEVFSPPAWEDPDYKLVYVDEITMVYARNNIIQNQSLIFSALQPELQTDLKFKEENAQKAQEEIQKLLSYDPKNTFALEQKVRYLIAKNDLEGAIKVSEKTISLVPNHPMFYYFLGLAKAQEGKCNEIALPLSEAKRLAGGYNYIKNEIDQVAAKCFLKI